MPVASIDTESYYDSKVSLKKMGEYEYLHHPDVRIYLVTIATDTGFEWAGPPEEVPWDKVSGPEWIWLHHNAYHEESVWELLRELGVMPEWARPGRIHCTADMAAYLGAPRALDLACEELLKAKLDKGPRDRAKGKQWDQMSPEFQREIVEYGLNDVRWPLKLWEKYACQWPEWERDFSALTRKMSLRGLYIDRARLDKEIGDLERLLWTATKRIPWSDAHPALSPKKLAEECRKVGIMPPTSLAIDSEDCAAWEEKYGDKYPWVAAMRTKRRANTAIQKFKKIRAAIRPDGRASLPIKYCGASTRRASGDGGANAQNMNRDPALGKELVEYGVRDMPASGRSEDAGVYLRECVSAPPGKKIAAVDKSQIEPRVLAVICGDTAMLEMLKRYDIYEAHARTTMGYDRPEPLKALKDIPEFERMRRFAKARVLGLGYQCGPERFVEVAWTLAQLRITMEEAEKTVADFRRNNPKIVALWRKLQRALERSVGSDLTLTLPSGNTLVYKKVVCKDGEYTALVPKKGRMMRMPFYGGKLTENLIQSISRDIFALDLLRFEEKYPVIMQTHDEGVVEMPIEASTNDLIEMMNIPPPWMPNVPLAAEATEGSNYAI